MSRDAVTGFLEKVAEHPQLQQKLAKAVAEQQDRAENDIVELARAHGFHFTALELRRVLADTADLSESELEAVAGGGVAPMIRKLTTSADP